MSLRLRTVVLIHLQLLLVWCKVALRLIEVLSVTVAPLNLALATSVFASVDGMSFVSSRAAVGGREASGVVGGGLGRLAALGYTRTGRSTSVHLLPVSMSYSSICDLVLSSECGSWYGSVVTRAFEPV